MRLLRIAPIHWYSSIPLHLPYKEIAFYIHLAPDVSIEILLADCPFSPSSFTASFLSVLFRPSRSLLVGLTRKS
jgi:hypothetical protein